MISVTILIVCVHSPLQDRLNSNSPGEDLDDWDDKDASGMDQGVLDESFFDDIISATGSNMQYQIIGTDESENSSLSLSGVSITLIFVL